MVHVRKLKRLGVKDNYYKLGKLKLVPKSKYLMAENQERRSGVGELMPNITRNRVVFF